MKVKLFTCNEVENAYPKTSLETAVNDFIKDKQVIDIKFSTALAMADDDHIRSHELDFSALVMYEED